jgi:alkylation response protein AidB-like acyl-CoA dehydrogenase
VPKSQVVGEVGRGWEIAKYLLGHEREMISGMGLRKGGVGLGELALAAIGGDAEGRLDDPLLRARVATYELRAAAFEALSEKSFDEFKAGAAHPALPSLLKYYGTELAKQRNELTMAAGGSDALGWEGQRSTEGATARAWLRSKANSIEGGTSEVQLNIVAQRLLRLPKG